MDRRLFVGVAALLVMFVGVGIGTAAVPSDQSAVAETSGPELVQEDEEIDRSVFRITVFENGDARWTLENRRDIPLSEEEEIEEFEQFAERFVEEETETFENFRARAQQLTAEGSNLTDRPMAATAFERDARYFNQEGIVEMSFRWEGFAEVENGSVIVSDIFDGGYVILEDQKLRFETGDNLAFDSIDPRPDQLDDAENSSGEWIEWEGPQEFSSGNPEIVFVPAEEATNGADIPPEGDGTVNGDQSDDEDEESDMMIPLVLTLLVLVSVGGGAIWYSKTQSGDTAGTAEPASKPPESGIGGESEARVVQEEELLSDEDRVIKLLEESGGRMRQVSIVEETEWSKSKVSMLLSDMEEDGTISKLRVGRENIISLAGNEPEAAGSPFEDE